MSDSGEIVQQSKVQGFLRRARNQELLLVPSPSAFQWASRGHYKDSKGSAENQIGRSKRKMGRVPPRGIMGI